MSRVALYIAASLDGYIAGTDGDISWLTPFEQAGEDYGYADFYARIGTVILGGKTYRQVLGFSEWPYRGVTTYVVTRRALLDPPDESIHRFAGDVGELVQDIRARSEKDIWLVCGGQLVEEFAWRDLIDEYIVSIIPLLLGEGVPLFPAGGARRELVLVDVIRYPNGLTLLHYRRRVG